MEFQNFLCENLKNIGNVKAKRMFGTFNINIDSINLGVICGKKWYLKQTKVGDDFLKEKNIEIPIGIKGNSYILEDFSDWNMIHNLVIITLKELKNKQR